MEHLIHQIAANRKWRYELPNFMPATLQHQMVLIEKLNSLSSVLYGESYRQGKKHDVALKKQKKKKSRVKKLVLLRKRMNTWLRLSHWSLEELNSLHSRAGLVYRAKKHKKWTFFMLQYWQLVKSFKWRKQWWKSLGTILRTPRRSSKLWWKIIKRRKPKRRQFIQKLLKKVKKRKSKIKKFKGFRLRTRWNWKFPKKWLLWDNSWYRSWKRVGMISYRVVKLYGASIYNGLKAFPLSTSWWEMDYDESVKARFIRKTTKSGKIQKRVNGVIRIT